VKVEEMENSMGGKTCLVTGATSGIGAATALLLAKRGATVIGVGRDGERCRRSVERITRATGSRCEFVVADLSVQSEIHRLAGELKKSHGKLDVLVNNVGARFLSRLVSADGLEMTFALNHLGHFLLTHLLLDHLEASGRGRIINVASSAHLSCPGMNFEDLQGEKAYSGKAAYAQSKLATLLFTYELDRRLRGTRTAVNAVDPGNVMTRFSRNNGMASWARHLLGSIRTGSLVAPAEGAKTCVYLACSPEVEGVSGSYFHQQQRVRSSAVSYDADAARRLWEIGLELTRMK
jgi:retinol dehydrogenase 14